MTSLDLSALDGDLLAGRLLPGGPLALARLEQSFTAFELSGASHLVLTEAWMLPALPQRAAWLRALATAGRLHVAPYWVRLDPYALPAFRPANQSLGRTAIEAMPGALALAPEAIAGLLVALPDHVGRAGLCLEQRALADRLVGALGSGPAAEGTASAVLAGALRALSPAGIGGCGDAGAEAEALALLRAACTALAVDVPASVSLAGEPAPPRARHLNLGGPGLAVEWKKGQGLTWQWPAGRSVGSFLSLEVQGDAGQRGAFVAGPPARPRIFEAGAMQLVATSHADGRRGALFVRELRLPSDVDAPPGAQRRVDWKLRLVVDAARLRIDVGIEIDRPVPGHRYRLWLPVPFWPRPARLATIEPDGLVRSREHAGPLPPTPVMPPVTLHGEVCNLQLGGPGLREVEILPRRNDHVCAVTLLRAPRGEPAPDRVVRELRLAFAAPEPVTGRR